MANDASLAVPLLNSLPGAAASLYLDFNGHYESSWGSYGAVDSPAYDTDGNIGAFSSVELANIQQIWQAVSEDFSPFNINVTTVEPPSFADGVAMRIVIGGNSSWTGSVYGGLSYRWSFTSSNVNTAYVFEDNLANGTPRYVADCVAHEAGHTFGLYHQSSYSGTSLTNSYSTGLSDGTAPTMGESYYAARSLWWYGTTTSSTTFQDDMSVIASATNGFGYRTDDHGDSFTVATQLIASDLGAISASGVISKMTDQDWFTFTTGDGTVSLTADVPNGYNDLDVRIDLYDADGALILSASPTDSFDATITTTLTAGVYHVAVSSGGLSAASTATNYGFNVGQYQLVGTIVPISSTPPAAPTNLTVAAITSSSVTLSWTDNATTELGYTVERLNNGSWEQIAKLGSDATSYQDTGLIGGTTYSYRVRAFDLLSNSDYSNTLSATTPVVLTAPVAPSNLTATIKTKPSTQIVLNWTDRSNNETGFYVERSTNGGLTWTRQAQLSANSTTYNDTNVVSGTTYVYRVIAFNAQGLSPASNAVQILLSTPSGNGKKGNPGRAVTSAAQTVQPTHSSSPTKGRVPEVVVAKLQSKGVPAAHRSVALSEPADGNPNVVDAFFARLGA
jgi:hypothetical protein